MKPELGTSSESRVTQALSQRNITWRRQTETERWVRRWGMSLFFDGSKYQLNLRAGTCTPNTCVCVCVYTEKEQTDGKLTLSETSVMKIIDGLSNFPELQTNIGAKPSYLGSNNIHRWIQVANWCSAMLQGHDLQNQNPAAVWKRVKRLGVARSSLIYQWIQIHISKLASKSQLFKAF